MNLYAMAHNNPIDRVDALGLADKTVYCGGTCGANIDDWILDEIRSLLNGWDSYKSQWPKTIRPGSGGIGDPGRPIVQNQPVFWDFATWIYANADYKNADTFRFSQGYEGQCGTGNGSDPPCGRSVTLCGRCVKSSVLGNVMYGLVGRYAGFSDAQLDSIQNAKSLGSWFGAVLDPNDPKAFAIGWGITGSVVGSRGNLTISDVCGALNAQPGFSDGSGLQVLQKTGSNLDTSKCTPCPFKTRETQHGGNFTPGINSGVFNP